VEKTHAEKNRVEKIWVESAMTDRPVSAFRSSLFRVQQYLRYPWLWTTLVLVAVVIWVIVRNGSGHEGADGGGRGGKKFGGGNGGAPISVAAATAEKGDLDVYLDSLGTVVPLSNVVVRSRVDGQLLRVHFREGQIVKEGELLAEVDPRPFQVQLTQAKGKLLRDEALWKNAQIDYERYQTLWQQDSISKQELDTQLALVKQYEGAVASDRGEVDSAELQLSYARITAPSSGRIGLRQVDPGNIVHASDPQGLLTITQLQPISVIFTIPEVKISAVMNALQNNNAVRVDAWDREAQHLLVSGTLLTFDSQIDTTTGTVKLKAVFDNQRSDSVNYLFPNQFVNIRLLVDTLKGVTLIPANAVQHASKGAYVYTIQNDNTVQQQPLELLGAAGDSAAVAGVEVGTQVVIDGTDRLRDGAKIAVIGPDKIRNTPNAEAAQQVNSDTPSATGKSLTAQPAGTNGLVKRPAS